MRILDDRPELWPYFLASLLLHLILLALIPQVAKAPALGERPIEVFAVEEPPPAQGQKPSRIADIAKPAVEERPKSASFLGLYDSTVPEEQVGISKGRGAAGGPAVRTRIGASAASRPADRAKRSARPAAKDRLFTFNRGLFDDRRLPPAEGAGGEARPSGMDDFYPDFRRGAHTYLNVLRYEGVEYFVRMKRAFKIAFNPEPSLRDYFSRNLVTRGSIDVVLGVTVNRGGDLAELFVFRSSGIAAYDQEALRTIRASAPFSTPPEKFLADDGLLRMSWTFSVYL